jgi:tRNA(Arg) A34 adenosine deaminase TadA
MNRHQRLLNRAIAAATISPHPRWPLGAVLARGNSVIATASNVQKNSPHILDGGPGTSVHAEIHALRKLTHQADRAQGCTLYIARVNRQGAQRLARPCNHCYKAISEAGIKTIVYTLDDESFGVEKVK